ncbi:LysR family transcriptional regulator [Vibrio natriegens]|uniref:LysR family transcriptional regulator n=1 Tax=Vibrio natriegens TaxID=691 RepID=UPI001FB9E2C1|nr:LysR family transcriptional regulator [Vibrio natriegens]
MDRFTAARVFVEISEQGSLTKAAKRLDMSTAMVSRYLVAIESWFGARLLHRTTRKVSLTAAGLASLPACKQMLLAAEDAKNVAQEHSGEVQGELRINATGSFADVQLTQAIVDFQRIYPRINIVLSVADNLSNLVEERVDLAIRITNTLDPTLISRPLALCRSVLCASPSYLKEKGYPNSLEDLQSHNCITHIAGVFRHYRFIRHGEIVEYQVAGNLQTNETEILRRAVISGAGIGMLPTYYVGDDLRDGKLVSILPQEEPEVLGIHAVYLSRNYQPVSLRLLVDFLVERFGGDIPPWERSLIV